MMIRITLDIKLIKSSQNEFIKVYNLISFISYHFQLFNHIQKIANLVDFFSQIIYRKLF